jgi:hypothetical protein
MAALDLKPLDCEGLLCQYPSSMGWIIEMAVDWIWTDVIFAAYRRYGLIAAAFAAP